MREAEDKGAEAHALHHSAHQHGLPLSLLRFGVEECSGQNLV